ncbi:TetR/AcrR family transcriptional regulator [Amycolatopsis vancoresmycina]|uniref:TetR family transcriptional regulator n=1 Tax=Amycolatopsis vancoresmycina DSM 44592 TaxID=1292037 RepID=R1I1J8_9PSEU|nr:TetR family transcriptional regulator [Amycolatopsis vancoresmycina]EOD69700.1 TetR family transcriptional regulator [Amycolatopsis vancoresmycina DSM 44592]
MTDRAQATRERILAAAERLYAEHGVLAVSNRQIGEAAGQGNNTVVGYHFGTRADVVRAIVRKHTGPIERLRGGRLDRGCTQLRDWLGCLVHPATEHLAELGAPTWFARFAAQVMTEPSLRAVIVEETLASPSLARTLDGLYRCLPGLPAEVRAERNDITRLLLMHGMAGRERALADGAGTPETGWRDTATALTDVLAGLWLAPVTE